MQGESAWPAAYIQHFDSRFQVLVQDVPVYGILDPALKTIFKPFPLFFRIGIEKFPQSVGIVAHDWRSARRCSLLPFDSDIETSKLAQFSLMTAQGQVPPDRSRLLYIGWRPEPGRTPGKVYNIIDQRI
jgi:hypothetical protein